MLQTDSADLASTNVTQFALEFHTFSVITQNNGHCPVKDHSRSLVLVPIESPYHPYATY